MPVCRGHGAWRTETRVGVCEVRALVRHRVRTLFVGDGYYAGEFLIVVQFLGHLAAAAGGSGGGGGSDDVHMQGGRRRVEHGGPGPVPLCSSSHGSRVLYRR